jgi:hypothetical protein
VKSTAALSVLSDFSIDERTIHIHPNDGFDLGLMTTEYTIRMHVGAETDPSSLEEKDFVYGKILLKNEVRGGHVELGHRSTERLDGANRAIVHYEPGERYGTILVTPVH